MSHEDADPDAMRAVRSLVEPDQRMRFLSIQDRHGSRALSQTDRHALVSQYVLADAVPLNVRVHFETARNLYLYAWYVYRFHAVAEQQALQALEMALRLRLIDRRDLNLNGELEAVLPPRAWTKPKDLKPRPMMLFRMLEHAADMNLVSNDRIVNRSEWAHQRAEHIQSLAALEARSAQGLTESTSETISAAPTKEDIDHDWIRAFVATLPNLRNGYAHGSSSIRANVLRTFDITSDLINQLFTTGGR